MKAELGRIETAILLTVEYAELFDCALDVDELYHRLIGLRCSRPSFDRALSRLKGGFLLESHGFVTTRRATQLVGIREERRRIALRLWDAATKYAGWLRYVPFVKMVAVSGSLAAGNAQPDADIDIFCVSEPDRLWLVRLFLWPISRATRLFPGLFPAYFCPNYVLTLDTLEVQDRNLYTAYETTQTVPLWGFDAYQRFVDANSWIHELLPHFEPASLETGRSVQPKARSARLVETLFNGRVTDAADLMAQRLFLSFYRRRAEKRGWDWEALAPAYQRGRYVIPDGGYTRVVRERFLTRILQRYGSAIAKEDLTILFGPHDHYGRSGYDWESLFNHDYGA